MKECDKVERRANAVIDVLNRWWPTCKDLYVRGFPPDFLSWFGFLVLGRMDCNYC